MDSEKRLIAAIALSVLVILGYQAYMRKHAKPYHKRITTQVVSDQDILNKQKEIQSDPYSAKPEAVESTEKRSAEETVSLQSGPYHAVLTNHGAAIKELVLVGLSGKEDDTVVVVQSQPGIPPVLATEDTVTEKEYNWRLLRKTGSSVTYQAEDAHKVLTKTITLHNPNYIIGLELNIRNKSSYPQEIRYKIVGGHTVLIGKSVDDMHVGVDAKVAGKIYRRKPSSKNIQGGELFTGIPAWASTRSRYFLLALKPEQSEKAAFIESKDRKIAWSGVVLGPMIIQPNDTVTHSYVLYAGPNNPALIEALGVPARDLVGYWVTSGIAKILLRGIKFIYGFTGNYGIAIILLTIVLSTLLFPLTRKSMRSMKEMQKIQPEVEKIKKDISDNPQKQQKAIMELYKEHKINPLGGCLPMLLQFPIFLSLFQVLPRSVELKGASFLWIKDLSSPDAAFQLPQKFPVIGNHINILPILMALAMFVQQKISQPKGAETSEQQRMMSIMMPIMFGFIFYNMASALVLYWLTNTVFVLLLQEVVLKSRKPE